MLDRATLTALDTTLAQFYSLLHHQANLNVIAAECEAILDGHAGRGNRAGILARDNWRDTWVQHGYLASGWFYVLELNGSGLAKPMAVAMYDALVDLFTEMARFVMDPDLRSMNSKQLKRVCCVCLKRRGIPAKAGRPAKPTRAYCLVSPSSIRWKGTVPVQPRHWHLLGCMLDSVRRSRRNGGDSAVPFIEIISQVFGNKPVGRRRISGVVSELNGHLHAIRFPSVLYTKDAKVFFDPPL